MIIIIFCGDISPKKYMILNWDKKPITWGKRFGSSWNKDASHPKVLREVPAAM